MLNFVGANTDWAHKNLYASIKRTDPNAKWRWHSWDAEHVFKSASDNSVSRNDTYGPTAIHQRLLASAEYKLHWADRIHLRLFNNGALSTAALQAAFNRRFAEIEPWGVRGESARWGDNRNDTSPYTYAGAWTTEKNRILTSVLPGRGGLAATPTTTALNQMKAVGLYPSTVAAQFRNNATDAIQHGGIVPAGFMLKMFNGNTGGAGTIYFTLDGTDPRTAWTGEVNPTAQTYSTPIALGASKTVRARILVGATWSALNEAYFSVGTEPASAASLVVSEMNYNPAAPTDAEVAAGHTQRRNFEFIELLNIGAAAVNLEGVRFGAGFDYTFTEASAVRELAPGERVLIVDNQAAFEMRHGAGKPVAGTFQLGTNLSDSGERIEVLAANGSVIRDFSYNDKSPWPAAADGDGFSLVLSKPQTNPDHNNPHNWRLSASAGGNPGASDVLSYATWKGAQTFTDDSGDDDGDGTLNCAEYFFRTDPALAASRPAVTGRVETHLVDPGPGLPPVAGDYLTLTFIRDPAADEATCQPQFSADLTSWLDGTNDLVRVSITPLPDGTVSEVWRSLIPVSADRRRYGRVQVSVP
jgi:hypothetical protein